MTSSTEFNIFAPPEENMSKYHIVLYLWYTERYVSVVLNVTILQAAAESNST